MAAAPTSPGASSAGVSVSGMVRESGAQALGGVTVRAVGNSESAQTDGRGVYRLTTASRTSLEFTKPGYEMQRLGVSYDWRREIAAHRPDYYKWDQWFFLKMLERGLAYKRTSPVNWCPKEETVLSNEQSSGGVCWRCGASDDWPVELGLMPRFGAKAHA